MEYKIVKVDTERTGNLPFVLIRQKDRTAEGVRDGDIVKVWTMKSGIEVSMPAICSLQFREFIAQDNVASVSRKVAEGLNVTIDDTIEINREVTESQAEAVRQEIAVQQREHFRGFMVALQRAGSRNTDIEPDVATDEPQVRGLPLAFISGVQ